MKTRLLSSSILIAALVAGGRVSAQSAAFSPELFHAAPGPDELVTIESARPLHHKMVGAGLYFDYARDPLSILTYSSRTLDPYGAKIEAQAHALSAEAWVGIGLWERLQIAVSLPMTLYQVGQSFDGNLPAPDGTHVRPPSGYALGDPRLYLKVRLYGKRDRGFQLALSHWLSVPIGNDGAFGGGPHFRGFSGEPRVLAEYLAARWLIALSVGYTWRVEDLDYYTAGAGPALTYGLGVGVDLLRKRLRLMAELYGHHDFHVDYTAASPLELDVSVRVRLVAGVSVTAGAGVGVIDGAGAPWPRVFAGLSYEPRLLDRDGDGVPDAFDRCPDVPEDRDGWEDEDGCPDPDNDGDGILDREDKCPDKPEDFDGWEDGDGCPDPDNDGDGIDDLHDACPNEKEDGLPPRPHDGCPGSHSDDDGDGINNALDKCPSEPEDVDGWEDEDGCPDPDNDNDGIPDGFDECPNLAEDMNGVDDDDGCPEAGATHVKLKKGELWLAQPIRFEGTTPGPAVQPLLDEIAGFLRVRTDLKVQIEGYWDAKGGERAVALSQAAADAVRSRFVKGGVAEGRLVSVGYGGSSKRRVELRLIKEAKKAAPPASPPEDKQDEEVAP